MFWKRSIIFFKDVNLEVQWTVKSFLKPSTALAVIHKFSHVALDHRKKALQVNKG